MHELSLILMVSAFAGGVVMFLAPCTLPIVPAFLVSLVPDAVRHNKRREITIRTISFTFGFSIIFFLFGLLSAYLGSWIAHYKVIFSQVGSVLIILFGLAILGVFELPLLKNTFQRIRVPHMEKGRFARPLLLGVVFALGWSPCAGPILASILLLASQSATLMQGGVLLLTFSLGLAVPFILTGLLYAQSVHAFTGYARYERYLSKFSGVFLIVLGVSLLSSQSILMSDFGFQIYHFFGLAPLCVY